jgi:hypothetical protein
LSPHPLNLRRESSEWGTSLRNENESVRIKKNYRGMAGGEMKGGVEGAEEE